ncbi:MAG TPA: LacI family DNA-binding transcriptional regulator [Terriglobales bacterium]|jgi:DNA-binding LacI/PurR family transcriptional regulator|nr:LacI family DNA-binding transcriptional regulator [Terriglobales bacterium]
MNPKKTRVTLKTIADYVGLTPGTISAVLNNTPAADRIPQSTRDRVTAAARELNYSPNPLARALRTGGSTLHQVGAEPAKARGALVIAGRDQFERALNAIYEAGLRIPDDVSIVDLIEVPEAWERPTIRSAHEDSPYEVAKLS